MRFVITEFHQNSSTNDYFDETRKKWWNVDKGQTLVPNVLLTQLARQRSVVGEAVGYSREVSGSRLNNVNNFHQFT
jgi:hypothetical protein